MAYGHNNDTKKKRGWNVKESKTRPNADPSATRVDLNPDQFDRLVDQKGVHVKVYRTALCPNVKSVDGAEHEIGDCVLCETSGFIDVDPIETKVFLQSQNLESVQNVEGFVQGNSCMATFKIGIELQYFSKITLLDFSEIYYQRVMRTQGSDTDILQYAACRVNFVIDSAGVRYEQGNHFIINNDGDLKWNAGKAPADNVIYSIHYECAVQYRAVSAVHVNRFSQISQGETVEHLKFPEQWLLTKEYLVRRRNAAGEVLKQGPFDDHTIVED